MLKRILTGAVAVCVLLPVLFFSHTIVFPIAIAVISIVALWELFKCIGISQKILTTFPSYCAAIIFPFLLRYVQNTMKVAMIAAIFALLYLIYIFALIVWSHWKFAFNEALTAYAMTLYMLLALNSIIYIRDYGDIGKYVYLLIFVGAWITDTFAYFTGMLIGKHKLIEDVSPKKTIEGSIGGIVFCALSFAAFGLIMDNFFEREANILFLIICGIIISVISQIGDLIMSVIKRHYKIKDFGKIFPGHGGIIDRFDSIFAVSIGFVCIFMFVALTGIKLL